MAKTKEQKSKELKKLTEAVNNSQAVIITNPVGLSVNNVNELRSALHAVGAKMMVTKNSLLKKVNTGVDTKGNSAIIYGYEKQVEHVKVLYSFIKEKNLPEVKLGILNGTVIDKEQVDSLAKLPSLDELRAKFVKTLVSPLNGFVTVSSGVPAAFVRVINGYKQSQE